MRVAELSTLAEPKVALIWGRVYWFPDSQGIEQSAVSVSGTLSSKAYISE